MKAGSVTYTTEELVNLNATDAFIVMALEKKFGKALQIQGLQPDGTRQIWVYKQSRNSKNKKNLQSFTFWVNNYTEYTATPWGNWGVTLKKDPGKNIRYFLPPRFTQWVKALEKNH